MRIYVFLFIFIFSPVVIIGGYGRTEIDKCMESLIEEEANSRIVKYDFEEKIEDWQNGVGSYYDPMDSSQTKKNPDGIGASGRKIERGSIAFGSDFTKDFIKDTTMIVFIEIKNCNTVTPYGKGIFRVDDMKAKRFNNGDAFYIDFHYKDTNFKQKIEGLFPVEFKIHKIVRTTKLQA